MGHGGPRSIAQCHNDQLECQNWHVLVVRVPGHGISENKAGQVRECWEVPFAMAREVRLKTVVVVVPGAGEGAKEAGRHRSGSSLLFGCQILASGRARPPGTTTVG